MHAARGRIGRLFSFIANSRSEECFLSGACLLLKKSLYEQTRGLDNNFFMYFEDHDWFWRLKLLGKCSKVSDRSFINHQGQGSTNRKGGLNRLRFLWRNENKLQMLLKNYKVLTLCFVLPAYFIKNMVEIACFCLILKPEIAWTYVQSWRFNIRYFERTLSERRWVQANRIVSDLEIMREMYKGMSEIRHLIAYIKS